MRIAILGAGGVGGYFGATLKEAGQDVVLLARGEHLAAIRRNGITIRTEGDSVTVPIDATDDPNELRGAELAIVAVKSYSLQSIAPVVREVSKGGAAILPLLNGVEATERLEQSGVASSQLLGGLTMVSAAKAAPGVISHARWRDRIVFGELDSSPSERVRRITEAFTSAGIETVASTTIVVDLWRKFNMLCAMAAACGLARSTVGWIRDNPLGRRLVERAVGEITAVGRAKGVALAPDQEAQALRGIDSVPTTMKPSFLLDLESGGPTELDVLSGAVSRFGRETGIPTPIHDTAAAALDTRPRE